MRKKASRYVSNEEIKLAIKIIKSILLSDLQTSEYFKSGDSDTLNVAREIVLNNHGIDGKLNENFDYSNFDNEIVETYNNLVDSGKKEIQLYENLLSYLDEIKIDKSTKVSIEEKTFVNKVTDKCRICGGPTTIYKPTHSNYYIYNDNICDNCKNNEEENGLPF